MSEKKRLLSLEMAKAMAEAAEAKAKELGLKVVIAILDDGGHLKYFLRMDGTSYGSVRVAQIKATSSASLPFSTRVLAERNAKQLGGPYAGGAIPGLVLLGGGLPILTKDGEHLGGIGISGATPELDEICAQAGLDRIASFLDLC